MDKKTKKGGFTLIEVMIAVMIISIVIMALIKISANNTHLFSHISQKISLNQYATFFIDNKKFGLQKDSTTLYELVKNFDIEDDLRKQLKNQKISLLYQITDTIDLGQFDDTKEKNDDFQTEEDKKVKSDMVFEIGKIVLKTKKSSVGYLRLSIKQ
ncbi:hypothetical protein MNB_SM-3-52 [hydrothermal vent metagenome]|uniref:Prepilin-type N-terminal cleavage/methylation domain-containing protein n=1 Tax=hydrothermal vent metagenome TaxID=652676 RepID=A0A1W1D4Y7_9ZZZZ